MDKEYLIHNIKLEDNPDDQHITMDLKISDIQFPDSDITADIGIDLYSDGYLAQSNSYDDVSLTGAGGGGGGISPFLPISLKIKKQGEVAINQVVTNIIADIENPEPDGATLLYPVLDCSELTEEYQDFNGYLPYIFQEIDDSSFVTIYTEYVLQFLSASNVSYPITWVETENITETSNIGFSIVDVSLPISATIIVHD